MIGQDNNIIRDGFILVDIPIRILDRLIGMERFGWKITSWDTRLKMLNLRNLS